MVEIRIDISELKAEGDEVIRELAEFLREKTSAEVETRANEIVVKAGETAISKKHLRVLLRKHLHKVELKNYFRVIGSKENTLIIKERKISEVEE
ncbi:MAG: 60S ribosomal protein L22 [Candidatus Bathyarchaeota archaeon]|nr:60S ribosomal protein L22 [Candidatus Bathyarchaeota archaeon]MDW8040352.1 60S ribosomal protein L22 [Nitrososphaerota archaeon]